jgi:hypothetical protein
MPFIHSIVKKFKNRLKIMLFFILKQKIIIGYCRKRKSYLKKGNKPETISIELSIFFSSK